MRADRMCTLELPERYFQDCIIIIIMTYVPTSGFFNEAGPLIYGFSKNIWGARGLGTAIHFVS